MNDLHYTNITDHCPAIQPELWLTHPEYRVGDHPGWHAGGALNFFHAAVRTQITALIHEIGERFDVDGIELDFLRFPVYFPYQQGAQYLPVITELMREVRQWTRALGARRGKPCALALRLPRSMAHCRAIGLDVPTWAREGLVDCITIGAFFFDEPALPLAAFREELGAETVPVYGSMDNGLHEPREFRTHGMYRASAAHLYRQGADGIALFNFFCGRQADFYFGGRQLDSGGRMMGIGPARCLLQELGAADTLRGRNKFYTTAPPVDEFGYHYAAELPLMIPQSTDGQVTISLAEQLADIPARYALAFVRFAGQGELRLWVNGVAAHRAAQPNIADLFGRRHLLAPGERVLSFDVPPAALRDGRQTLRLRASNRGAVQVIQVDVAIGYGDPEEHGKF